MGVGAKTRQGFRESKSDSHRRSGRPRRRSRIRRPAPSRLSIIDLRPVLNRDPDGRLGETFSAETTSPNKANRPPHVRRARNQGGDLDKPSRLYGRISRPARPPRTKPSEVLMCCVPKTSSRQSGERPRTNPIRGGVTLGSGGSPPSGRPSLGPKSSSSRVTRMTSCPRTRILVKFLALEGFQGGDDLGFDFGR